MIVPNRWFLPLVAACLSACIAPTEVPGAVRMELQSTTDRGVVYRLVNANLTFAGTETVSVSSEPDAETLERDLLPGAYDMTLEEGWVLQRDAGDGFMGVEAVLLTPNPQPLVIVAGEITEATLRFGVGDGFIEFGHGRARIGIDVEESPPYGGTTTFAFEATVTYSMAPDIAAVGAPIRGTYTFDITAPDERGDPNFASYYFDHEEGEFELEVVVGGLTVRSVESDPANFSSTIYVKNDSVDHSTIPRDQYSFLSRELEVVGAVGLGAESVRLELNTTTNLDAIESTALPIEPPDVAAFAGATQQVSLSIIDPAAPFGLSQQIRADLTSLRRVE
ncbi:MAG: hypothetical protein AB8I08_28240 [Sandaracinaceae bacterium]